MTDIQEEDYYFPGKGCKCYAHSEYECACPDVDWTDSEVYKLREENDELKKEIVKLKNQLAHLDR